MSRNVAPRKDKAALTLMALLAFAPAARAQSYARFQVPDSLLARTVANARGEYEVAWNSLLVAELRAVADRMAPAQGGLRVLETRIARVEAEARGTHIAPDALELRVRWTPAQRLLRIHAAESESLAASAQAVRSYARADSLFRSALADYRRLGEKRREAWVLGSLGLVAFSASEPARADSLYRAALVSRQALGDPMLIGNTLNSLGSTNYLLGRYAEARDFLKRARSVRERTGERGPLGSTLNYLGLTLFKLGEPDSARACYQRALDLTVAAGDSTRTAEVLVNTMTLLTQTGAHRGALELGERALAIHQQSGNGRAAIALESNLGNLMRVEGRFAAAADHFERQAALARDLGSPRDVALALLSLGHVGLLLRDPTLGRPPLVEARILGDSLNDSATAVAARIDLADLASWENDPMQALRLAEEALARSSGLEDPQLRHDVLTTLGELAVDRGDLAEGRSWYARAEESGRGFSDDSRASDLNNLGIAAVLQESLGVAQQHFELALTTADRAQSPDQMWPPLLGLGEVAERRGDYQRALSLLRRAATLIDTLRSRQSEETHSIALLSGRMFAIEALIHLLTRLDTRFPDSAYAAEAFDWSERSRARSLGDLLERASQRMQPADPISLERLQAALPPDRVAYLQYSLGDSSSSLWVVTRGVWHHFRLPSRRQLRSRIEILRRGLSDPTSANAAATRRASFALYSALLEPARSMLRGIKRLIISADGPLALIPFEALLTRVRPGDGLPGRDAYLIERFDIAYAPSAAIYVASRGRASNDGILALGNPSFIARGQALRGLKPVLPALPQTVAEIEALRRLAGARSFRALMGIDATREELLGAPELASAALVHLATHGAASELDAERCGLWLAPGPGGVKPGFLSATEVFGLHLDADLVTLSACETGVGRLVGGEGVLGLPRAFLAAGARSVLVSLWEVNDTSTARLMEFFYQELLDGGRPAPQALANAKRRMLADPTANSPFQWAAFVLMGRYPEGRPVRGFEGRARPTRGIRLWPR